jgi:hypothetical protein
MISVSSPITEKTTQLQMHWHFLADNNGNPHLSTKMDFHLKIPATDPVYSSKN